MACMTSLMATRLSLTFSPSVWVHDAAADTTSCTSVQPAALTGQSPPAHTL